MALPLVLDPPPEVFQTGLTCWAASYESWSRANARLIGIESPVDDQATIEWFQSHPNLLTAEDRVTRRGYAMLSCRGLMTLNRYSPRDVTAELLGELLESGYLYVIYQGANSTSSHCVVCYGADHKDIHVMDPWAGRGLIRREPSFFLQMQGGHGVVVIGTPGIVALSRGIGDALSSLRPPPVQAL
jgi:hypothetical protein